MDSALIGKVAEFLRQEGITDLLERSAANTYIASGTTKDGVSVMVQLADAVPNRRTKWTAYVQAKEIRSSGDDVYATVQVDGLT